MTNPTHESVRLLQKCIRISTVAHGLPIVVQNKESANNYVK